MMFRRFLVQAADVLALFKVERVLLAVPIDGGIKVFAGVLGGAAAQAVEPQGVLIVVPVLAVLAAGVQLTDCLLYTSDAADD